MPQPLAVTLAADFGRTKRIIISPVAKRTQQCWLLTPPMAAQRFAGYRPTTTDSTRPTHPPPTQARTMIELHLDIPTADGAMNTCVVHPDEGGPHPVVLFYMDAPGKREELHTMARRLEIGRASCRERV